MAATVDLFDFEAASRALDRIKRVAVDMGEFKAEFSEIIGKVGFRFFVIASIPGPFDDLKKFVVLKEVPEEWEKIYLSNNYLEIDPVAERCRSATKPFLWNEAMMNLDKGSRSYMMMLEAARFGLTNGVCFPIHGVNGYEALISLSGKRGEISANDIRNLNMFCLYSFSLLKTIIRGSVISVPQLTRREREILMWTALGKTNKEISELLYLSVETISTHVKNIIKKLAVQNKAEAVATALRGGIIPG